MKTKHAFFVLALLIFTFSACNTGKHYARLRINHSYQQETESISENKTPETEKAAAPRQENEMMPVVSTTQERTAVKAETHTQKQENSKVGPNRFVEPAHHESGKAHRSLKDPLSPAPPQFTDEKSGGSALATILIAILLFLLALVFLAFLGAIGLIFFIIFTIAAVILLIAGLISML